MSLSIFVTSTQVKLWILLEQNLVIENILYYIYFLIANIRAVQYAECVGYCKTYHSYILSHIDHRQNTDTMSYQLQNTIRSQTLVEGGAKRQNT